MKRSILNFVIVAVFAVTCGAPGVSQTKLSGQIDGIDPDHAYVLRLVSGVLQDMRIYLWGVEPESNDLLSNSTEFRSHLLLYRARFRFHVEGNALIVTIENLQSPAKGTWTRSLIPADGAEAKLVAQVVEHLNAVNQKFMQERGSPAASERSSSTGQSQSGVTQFRKAKSLVFDPVPVRCAEGLCPVRRDGLWGFIDYDGNLVLDFQFHSDDVPYFSDGACFVRAADGSNRMLPGYVYIDKKGKTLFDGKIFQSVRRFVNGLAVVGFTEKTRNGWNAITAVLDHQGRLVPLHGISSNEDFHDGLIVAREVAPGSGKAGFLDSQGHWVIAPLYENVQAFSNGAAWVEQITVGGAPKWGAINTKGQVIVPFEFSRAPEPFSEELAVVTCTNDTKGYVDKAGTLVLPCQYRQASPFFHSRAFVVENAGRRLLIDERGQVAVDGDRLGLTPAGVSTITRQVDGRFEFVDAYTGSLDETWSTRIPPTFTAIAPFPMGEDPNGLAWAKVPDGKQGFINRRGEFVVIQQQGQF